MTWQPITEAEARGDSQPLPYAALEALARRGERVLAGQPKPGSLALASAVDAAAGDAWGAIQEPWGGLTVDLSTGKPVTAEHGWAVATGKTRRLPLDATLEQVREAILGAAREADGGFVGVFRDDDLGAVDVDPSYVAPAESDAVAVGVARHATGGAYDFSTGNALWMPHLAEQPAESFAFEAAPRRRRRVRRVDALSAVYNEIPETRGTARGAGVIAGGGRDLDDQAKLAAWRAQAAAA